MIQTLRLFKALPIKTKNKRQPTARILSETLKRGFVFSPVLFGNYTDDELSNYILSVVKELGLTKEQANASFHKSWGKVKNAPMEQLVMEQIAHYITTYGFEQLGIYNEACIYVPKEELNVPGLEEGFNFIIIKGLTKEEIKEKLLALLQTGIAMKEDTMADCIAVSEFVGFDRKDVESVKNKEIKITFYNKFKFTPENPTEFLRMLIYLSTKKTLIIKDKATIGKIKQSDNTELQEWFVRYKKEYGYAKLSEVFNRYKPLFIAFKTNKKLKQIINKLAKLSKIHHVPMKEDVLNSVTAHLATGKEIKAYELVTALKKANIFRKARLAYALNFRTKKENESIMYRIRNGKSYATKFDFNNKSTDSLNKILYMVLGSIVSDLRQNVKGKRIYIPKNITYALPTTEKQFVGNIPAGSFVTVEKDIIFGVHWEDGTNFGNTDGYSYSYHRDEATRVDLDLSTISVDGKIGWDRNYRSGTGDVLFSGDMTAAPKPNGASELFYITRQKEDVFLVCLNYFNFSTEGADFKILVGSEKVRNMKHNYMINPNNILAVAKTRIDKKQNIVGLVVANTKMCKYYFIQTAIGDSITSQSHKEYIKQSREYLYNYYKNSISLNDLLADAGAILVEDKDEADIDLSMEAITKDTIINLLRRKEL